MRSSQRPAYSLFLMTQTVQKSFEKVDRSAFDNTHLLGIEDLSVDEINIILDLADYYADQLDEPRFKSDILSNQVVMTLFFEDSTRTRTSFEMAGKRLGADVINIDVRTSSLNKGESFSDTIKTLNAIGPDSIVVRHSEYGAPKTVSTLVDCPVINAGDSWREHPTQALLDALTIRRRLGTIEGKTIAMIGDIAHSRVANSNMLLFSKLGAKIHVIAPEVLMPEKFPADNIDKFFSLEDGLQNVDIVISDRIYLERMEATPIKSEQAYFEEYGLTKEKLAYANDNVVILAPGPIIRGVQLSDDVADDKESSLILEQVRNGVPTRMAIMDLLMKGNTQ